MHVDKNGVCQCGRCSKDFCYNDFNNHRQQLSKQLEEFEVTHNIYEQISEPQKHPLIEEISEWNCDIISKNRQDSIPSVNIIYVTMSSRPLYGFVNISLHTKWRQNGITIAGGNRRGTRLNQLSFLQHTYMYVDDDDQTIYIDSLNDRIMEKTRDANTGQIVAGGNGQGNKSKHLSFPTDVIIDKKNDSLIICDYGNRQEMLWSCLNDTIRPITPFDLGHWSLTMDNNKSLYVSDTEKHEAEAMENRKYQLNTSFFF